MFDLLFLFHSQDIMGTEIYAETAVDADHRFIDFIIPVYCANYAGFTAVSAANALFQIDMDPTPVSRCQGIGGTYFRAGRIFTGPADYYRKTPFHSADGPYPYA
jgi:hypothetical protein